MKKTPYLKLLFVPVMGMVLIGLMSVLVASFLVGKINDLTAQSSVNSTQLAQLENKLSSLEKIDSNSELLSQSESVYIAFPDKNPAVFAVSQIRRYAQEMEIVITKLNVSSSGSKGEEFSQAGIQFTVEGDYGKISEFVEKLKSAAPLMSLERVKISQISSGASEATVLMTTYWASFPETLPSVTSAVSDLTEEEINLLSELASLEAPQFVNLPPSATVSARPNPFKVE